MAESLHHLDLLLQLQAECFQETLERHVSTHYVSQITDSLCAIQNHVTLESLVYCLLLSL